MDARMKHALAIAALALLAGCATQPKPCTAEWFDWKTDRFLDEFANEHRAEINDLRTAALRLDPEQKKASSDIGARAVAAVKGIALAGEFLSDTWPAVKDAVSECGTAPRATQLFASLLRREGFDEQTVKAVEDLGLMLDRDAS
jgi:hypothetical protein